MKGCLTLAIEAEPRSRPVSVSAAGEAEVLELLSGRGGRDDLENDADQKEGQEQLQVGGHHNLDIGEKWLQHLVDLRFEESLLTSMPAR